MTHEFTSRIYRLSRKKREKEIKSDLDHFFNYMFSATKSARSFTLILSLPSGVKGSSP